MTYLAQSKVANNGDLMVRITACAASRGIKDPDSWANSRKWFWSVQDGWVPAFTEAGERTTGITDEMILAAVEKAIAAEAAPPGANPEPSLSPAE